MEEGSYRKVEDVAFDIVIVGIRGLYKHPLALELLAGEIELVASTAPGAFLSSLQKCSDKSIR